MTHSVNFVKGDLGTLPKLPHLILSNMHKRKLLEGLFLIHQESRQLFRIEKPIVHRKQALVFVVPAVLPAGSYVLEVRAVFGNEDLRSGRLHPMLTVVG